MLRSLALAMLAAGVLAAGMTQAASVRRHARTGHHQHHHLASAARYSRARGLRYPSIDAFAASSAQRRNGGYADARFAEGHVPLAWKTRLGHGAMGSVGLQHAYPAGALRDINGVMLSVPPPASSLVGAGVSYRF